MPKIMKNGVEYGGGSTWNLLGTLTKTWNGSNAQYSRLEFPATTKELYIVIDYSKSDSSMTFFGYAHIEDPVNIGQSTCFLTSSFRQAGFGMMINYSNTTNTITAWQVYDTSGTGLGDGGNCEMKVYYR